MKKGILIISILLAAAALSAGSFWGGMTYQTNKVEQAQANFFATRGQGPDGVTPSDQMPGGGQFPNDGQIPGGRQGLIFGGGGGASGQIKSIDGDVITLSTAEDVTTINLSEDTRITKMETVSLADLEPGMRISVIGQKDEDGNISAVQIQIIDESITDLFTPSETRTAP
jgi:hypothetical protein